jgi:aminoglycoside phosphotransferase (APT) family kinase protein
MSLDKPRSIRTGEEFDARRLNNYLREHIADATGDVTIAQFPSGFSNLTYMLTLPTTSGTKEFVLRRPPFGANIKSAHDMEREYRVISAVKPLYSRVPQPILFCNDETVLGAPFYIMERVQGVILRNTPPTGIELTPDVMRRLSEMLIDNLAALHSIDASHASIRALSKPDGYTERQVKGWTDRYQQARTDELAAMEFAAKWLLANIPTNTPPPRLLHNDYKYDNVVFSPAMASIVAVLDWEMATIGDPLMDLGTTLGYWAEANDPPALKSFGLTSLEGNLSRREIVTRYAEKTGADVSNIAFYYAFGLFKIGVIAQQIYARYKKGFTNDERFGTLIHVTQAAGEMAAKTAQTGSI